METKKLNAESKPSVTIDELYKIRVLDPDTASKTELLKAECKEFVKSTVSFQQIIDGFLSMIDSLAQNVERERMKAIGGSNLIDSMSKIRETEQRQLQTLLMEKTIELERLRLQYQSLVKTKHEQQEYIDLLTINR